MASGVALVAALLVAVTLVGMWHLTQGTSGVGMLDLARYAVGAETQTFGGVSVADIFAGSRLPRLLAGVAVGIALGVAGALLQSVTRNTLASPDTLAVTAGAYLSLTAVAAFGIVIPVWASSGVAFVGGLLAAALVLGLSGVNAATGTTRLILAGSAIAMALDALTAMLLILFSENTTGLFAWGSGSLAQLNVDASVRATPVIVVAFAIALLLSRKLDVLGLGDDTALSLGVNVRTIRLVAIITAVVLTAIAVTLAGPIAFVGLGAPVLARLLANKIEVLHKHLFLIPVSGLLGALLILLADAGLRGILGAEGASAIPTGIPTAFLGAIVIVLLALRLREAGAIRQPKQPRSGVQNQRRFIVVLVATAALLLTIATVALLAGSLWLRFGDIAQWISGTAPPLISSALDDRSPRVLAALVAGAALALAGCVVQSTVRNPLAEPSILGITAGASLGAVFVVTALDGSRPLLITMAVVMGLITFAVITVLAWRGGLQPDRFVLIGIGIGYALSALTTFMLLRADPWNTPRILTWLSGTTYGRTLPDVLPVAIALVVAVPVLFGLRRQLDIIAIDEDTPRILGVRLDRTRLGILAIAAVLAALSVVAVGAVGFVGLVAPHLARALIGAKHSRLIPVSMLLGAILVCAADMIGRTIIAPAQIPVGLMIALIGAPYFVWLLRKNQG